MKDSAKDWTKKNERWIKTKKEKKYRSLVDYSAWKYHYIMMKICDTVIYIKSKYFSCFALNVVVLISDTLEAEEDIKELVKCLLCWKGLPIVLKVQFHIDVYFRSSLTSDCARHLANRMM